MAARPKTEIEKLRIVQKAREDLLAANMALFDTDNDGFFSAAEARNKLGIHLNARDLPDSNVDVIDSPIFDRNIFVAMMSKATGINPSAVSALVKDVFPKGVETIMLSDECAADPSLGCGVVPDATLSRTSYHRIPRR